MRKVLVVVASTLLLAGCSSAPAAFAAAEIQAGTEAAKMVAPDQLTLAHDPQTLTDGATISWNMANGFNAKVTLGGVTVATVPGTVSNVVNSTLSKTVGSSTVATGATTSFTIDDADVSGTYNVGRRVRVTIDDDIYLYSTILAVSYSSPDTTITIEAIWMSV